MAPKFTGTYLEITSSTKSIAAERHMCCIASHASLRQTGLVARMQSDLAS